MKAQTWLRRGALGLAGLLLLVVLVGLGGYLYVTSAAGGLKIRQTGLDAVKGALAGELEVEGLQLHGRSLSLRGVTLKTPEGEVVARLEALDATVRLGALIHRSVDLQDVRVEGLHLFLREDPEGLNLSRALASREPASALSPAAPKGPSSWSVRLEGLQLSQSEVDFRSGTETHAHLDGWSAQGQAAWTPATQSLTASLTSEGALTAPVAGPLRLSVQASGQGASHAGSVVLGAAGLQLRLRVQGKAGGENELTLEQLQIPPALARAALPAYPLIAPVALKGHALQRGSSLQVALQGEAGSARLTLDGALDLAHLSTTGMMLSLSGVNLAELLDDGPKSHLSLELQARGGGTSLETLHGQMDLVMPASRVRGEAVGPVRAHVKAQDGTLDVSELLAVLPGLRLTGAGHGDAKHVHFAGQLQATDLSALARTFGGINDQTLPAVHGSGTLSVHVDGPLRHPGLDARGSFTSLRFKDRSVEQLSVSAQLPDVRRPLEANASLHARKLSFGGKSFDEIQADLVTKGRALDGNITTQGLANVVIHVGGTLDTDGDGIELTELFLRYPEAQWGLEKAAHLRFPTGALSTPGLTLVSGSQRVSLSGEKTDLLLRAELKVQGLDLGMLPRAIAPERLGLGGQLNLKLVAGGRPAKPRLDADLSLERGVVQALRGLEVQLQAHCEKDRTEGKLRLAAWGTALTGEFELPVRALVERRHVPVRAELKLSDLDLGKAVCTFARDAAGEQLCAPDGTPRFSGRGSSQLSLTGTADAPRLAIALRAEQLKYPGLPPGRLELTVASDEVSELDGKLHAELLGGASDLRLDTPLTLAALLDDKPPTPAQLRAMSVRIRWDAQNLALAGLSTSGLVATELAGTLTAHADVKGPLESPLGTLELGLAKLQVGAMKPLDVTLHARSTESSVVGELVAQGPKGRLLRLQGSLLERLGHLGDAGRLARTPLTLEGSIGPLQLEDFPLPAPGDSRGGKRPRGSLVAQLNAKGTLAHPEWHLRARLQDTGVGTTTLGKAELAYDHAGALHVLAAQLESQGGGALSLGVRGQLEVSYPDLPTALAVSNAPFTATVDSDGFELAPLSGLLPSVRRIGGKLRLHAKVQGPLHAPGFQGDLGWDQGTLALEGYGQYDGVHLALKGSNDEARIEDLSAHAGAGKLSLSAEAVRQGSGAQFSVKGRAQLDAFPLITDDQLLATASLRATFSGTADPEDVNLGPIDIPEAHFELPDVKRKNLQELKRPDDIILLSHGKPVDKHAREQLAAQAKALRQVLPAGLGAPTPAATMASRRYVLTLKAPRNLWLKSNDIQAEAGLSDGFRVEVQNETEVFGEVRFMRGRADVLGRRFDVQKNSKVQFTGPPTSPYVDVTALYNNTQEGVKVTMNIRGQGRNITLQPTSEPPLSDSEIYTLIATGRTSLKRGSGSSTPSATGQAASALGSLVATQLKKALANKLPLDVISIEAGDQSTSQGFSGSVEAGRYFGDRFYVGYQGRIGADPTKYENSNSVRAEYQFSPRWSAEGEYGDARKGGLDLIWSRDY